MYGPSNQPPDYIKDFNNGPAPVIRHNKFEVLGNDITLSGTLSVSIKYDAVAGDRIVFLTAANIINTFATINPALPPGWDQDYSITGEVALVYSGTVSSTRSANRDPEVGVFPNPFSDQLNLIKGKGLATLYDISGQPDHFNIFKLN